MMQNNKKLRNNNILRNYSTKERLRKKLELRKNQDEKDKLEGKKKKIEWGSQIRNYVLHPYKMVKDLRTNHESTNPDAILDGDLNPFIRSYLMEFGQK